MGRGNGHVAGDWFSHALGDFEMKLALLPALISLILLVACTKSEPVQDAGATLDTATAATCANYMKGKTQMNLKQVLTCAALICATYPTACASRPPTPAGTGGSYSTGGASSTGGARATGGMVATGGASGQTPEQAACANELALGCPEGTKPTCAADMALRCSNPKVKCNTACIVGAKTKSELQTKCFVACGGL